MSKKWLFALAIAYVAWVTAATFYWKNKKELKQQLGSAETNNQKAKIIFDAFVNTHINMVNKVKEELFTEENKQKFSEYKDEVVKIFDSYKEKWTELVVELKEKGQPYVEKTTKKLEELYNSKSEEIEKLKGLWADTISFLKEKLLFVFNKTKSEIKNETEKLEIVSEKK